MNNKHYGANQSFDNSFFIGLNYLNTLQYFELDSGGPSDTPFKILYYYLIILIVAVFFL